jgi:hypothetical protein
MENVREGLISLGWRDSGVYQLLKELAAITLDREEIVNRGWVELGEVNIRAIPRLGREPGPVV